MILNVKNLGHREINELIRKSDGEYTLTGCCGQRFIAAGMSEKKSKFTAYLAMLWAHISTEPSLL